MRRDTKKSRSVNKALKEVKREIKKESLRKDILSLDPEEVKVYYNVMTISGYALSTFHSCIDYLCGNVKFMDKVDEMRNFLLNSQLAFYKEAVNMGRVLEKAQTQVLFDDMFKKMALLNKDQMEELLQFFADIEVPELEKVDI